MERLFFFLYSFIFTIVYVLALPFLILLSFRTKYRTSIPSRFFIWNNKPLKANGIWFHSCSFGEAKAIKPLVDSLDKDIIRMSTTTQTGYSAISDYTIQSRYLPFEPILFLWMKPQKALVVMEAEFWYLLFALASKKGAKTMLINARMSDKSFPKYMKLRWLYVHIFAHIDEVYAQTTLDKERLEKLGASNVVVTGNIKLSSLPKVTKDYTKHSELIVCGASTHHKEEELILEAFSHLKKQDKKAILFLVPRHPERFGKVASLCKTFSKKEGLSMELFSEQQELASDIVLIDSLGELVNMYAISDIVIIGGAFEPIGGHNVAEASQFGCKVISGDNYFNQTDIFNSINNIEIVKKHELTNRLLNHIDILPSKIKSKSNIGAIVDSLNKIA